MSVTLVAVMHNFVNCNMAMIKIQQNHLADGSFQQHTRTGNTIYDSFFLVLFRDFFF